MTVGLCDGSDSKGLAVQDEDVSSNSHKPHKKAYNTSTGKTDTGGFMGLSGKVANLWSKMFSKKILSQKSKVDVILEEN